MEDEMDLQQVINLSTERNADPPVTENERRLATLVQQLTAQLEEMQRGRRGSATLPNTGRELAGESSAKTIDERAYGGDNQFGGGRMDMVPMQARLPRGGWIKNPFDDLQYKGKSDKQNPIRFLEKFERLARYEGVTEDEQLFHFGKCMRGAASQWHELQIAKDIYEIKEKFKQHFWGCQAQMRFRQQIYFGKYKPGETSMTEYALDMARQAKTLVPPMTDEEVVQTLREHFDGDIARELRPSVTRNVNEMIQMLDTLENEREARKLRNEARRSTDRPANRLGYERDAATNRGARTREDARQNNFTRRDAAARPSPTKSASWRRTDAPEAKTRGGVDIIEEPNSDDSQARPRITRYTRDKDNNPKKEILRSQERDDKNRSRGDRGKNLAAITAKDAPSNDGDADSVTSEGSDKECCAITGNEPPEGLVARHEQIEKLKESFREIIEQNHRKKPMPPDIRRITESIQEMDRKIMEAEKIKEVSEDVPLIELKFEKSSVKALEDTGSQITAMTRQLEQRLSDEGERLEELPIKRFLLNGAFADKGTLVERRVRVRYRHNETRFVHECCIVEQMAFDMILGIDSQRRYQMLLACDSRIDIRFRQSIDTLRTSPQMKEIRAPIGWYREHLQAAERKRQSHAKERAQYDEMGEMMRRSLRRITGLPIIPLSEGKDEPTSGNDGECNNDDTPDNDGEWQTCDEDSENDGESPATARDDLRGTSGDAPVEIPE